MYYGVKSPYFFNSVLIDGWIALALCFSCTNFSIVDVPKNNKKFKLKNDKPAVYLFFKQITKNIGLGFKKFTKQVHKVP